MGQMGLILHPHLTVAMGGHAALILAPLEINSNHLPNQLKMMNTAVSVKCWEFVR